MCSGVCSGVFEEDINVVVVSHDTSGSTCIISTKCQLGLLARFSGKSRHVRQALRVHPSLEFLIPRICLVVLDPDAAKGATTRYRHAWCVRNYRGDGVL